jgi:hypothetical protein
MRYPVRCGSLGAVLVAALVTLSRAEARAEGCAVWDATYTLSGVLRISDTQMGAGDGAHRVGPGALVLRFFVERPEPHVELRAFDLREHFAIMPRAVFFSATVFTDAIAKATPDDDGVIARGVLATTPAGPTLRWSSPVRAYRSDGVLSCEGSLCGKFGAPAPGRSATHTPPHAVRFESFRFGGSGLTFEMMGYSVVSEEASPRQKTSLHLEGRASSWVCVEPGPASPSSGGAVAP